MTMGMGIALNTTDMDCAREVRGYVPEISGGGDCECTNCPGFGACECNCDCPDEG